MNDLGPFAFFLAVAGFFLVLARFLPRNAVWARTLIVGHRSRGQHALLLLAAPGDRIAVGFV